MATRVDPPRSRVRPAGRAVALVAATVVAAAGLSGCGSSPRAAAGSPPPVPSGPTQPSSSGTPSLPDVTPSQTLPSPASYPDLRVTGVDGCTLLTSVDLERFDVAVAEGVNGADGSCDYVRPDGDPDTFLFLHASRTLAQWGAEQPDYTAWQPLTVDGVTGVMASGGPQCSGVLAVAADATLEVLVDAAAGDQPCVRATEVITAALGGLRAAQ